MKRIKFAALVGRQVGDHEAPHITAGASHPIVAAAMCLNEDIIRMDGLQLLIVTCKYYLVLP